MRSSLPPAEGFLTSTATDARLALDESGTHFLRLHVTASVKPTGYGLPPGLRCSGHSLKVSIDLPPVAEDRFDEALEATADGIASRCAAQVRAHVLLDGL